MSTSGERHTFIRTSTVPSAFRVNSCVSCQYLSRRKVATSASNRVSPARIDSQRSGPVGAAGAHWAKCTHRGEMSTCERVQDTRVAEKRTCASEKSTPRAGKSTCASEKRTPRAGKGTCAVEKRTCAGRKSTCAVEEITCASEKGTRAGQKSTRASGKGT